MKTITASEPTWLAEFGAEWQIPDLLANDVRFSDASWHNDICPSFQIDIDAIRFVVIWADHPAAERREMPEWKRFRVCLENRGEGTSEDLLETDDVSEAIACAIKTQARK